MRLQILGGSLLIAFVFLTPLIVLLGYADSHRTNFRYLSWKYGKAPQDYKWCLHLANVDGGLHDGFKGKSKSELSTWFPELAPPSMGSWQRNWIESEPRRPGETYEVIGNSQIAVRFLNGKFDTLIPMKG